MYLSRSILSSISAYLFVGAVLTGCGTPESALQSESAGGQGATADSQATQSGGDRIQVGDQVKLSVFGYPEFDCTATVNDSGTINVPLVGEIQAAGLTRMQFTDRVAATLTEYVKSTVLPSVTINSAMAQKVVVLGSVMSQGSFTMATSASAFQVLALAGGPAKDADLAGIRVMRNGDPDDSYEIDLSGLVTPEFDKSRKKKENLPLINPGDILYVPKESNFFRDFSDILRDTILLFGFFSLVR
jgi:polysaccharide biosynthesis/export protein